MVIKYYLSRITGNFVFIIALVFLVIGHSTLDSFQWCFVALLMRIAQTPADILGYNKHAKINK